MISECFLLYTISLFVFLFFLTLFFVYSVSFQWLLRMIVFLLGVTTFLVSQLGNWTGLSGFYLLGLLMIFFVSRGWILFFGLIFYFSQWSNYFFLNEFHRSGVFLSQANTYQVSFYHYLTHDFSLLIFFFLWCSFISFFHRSSSPIKNTSSRSLFSLEQALLTFVVVLAGLFSMSTDHLLTLYVNLELQALSLYTLVGYFKREDENVEAALRYLLVGSFVSGFTLLGFIHLYVESGSFLLSDYRVNCFHSFVSESNFATDQDLSELTRSFSPMGTIWLIGIFLFKLGLFPFHFWSPSVYTPLDWFTLFVVLGPAKINLWYLIGITFQSLFFSGHSYLWLASLVSILIGSIGGLFQKTISSLLAYSSILNGGYLLLLSLQSSSSEVAEFTFVFYLWIYSLGTALLLVVFSVYPQLTISSYSSWNGLPLWGPLLNYYLVLNLSGLPVFPGFFSKLFLLYVSFSSGGMILGFFLVLFSIPAAFFYLLVGSQALLFFQEEKKTFPLASSIARANQTSTLDRFATSEVANRSNGGDDSIYQTGQFSFFVVWGSLVFFQSIFYLVTCLITG